MKRLHCRLPCFSRADNNSVRPDGKEERSVRIGSHFGVGNTKHCGGYIGGNLAIEPQLFMEGMGHFLPDLGRLLE